LIDCSHRWDSQQNPSDIKHNISVESVFLVGVVSRKLQLGSVLCALHHGNIAKMTKPKKHSKPNQKLAESLSEIVVLLPVRSTESSLAAPRP
jgi:hypothetical protein